MRQFLVFAAMAMFLSSCGIFSHPVSIPGRNAANNAAGMVAADQYLAPANPEVSDICEPESLGYTRDSYRLRAQQIDNCQECTKDTVRRISQFYDEIDASYRMAATSCRSYARCMQNNFYDEGQCRSNLASWERARDDFGDLARELREIEAEVDRDRINRRGGHYRGAYINRHERCDCSDSVGGVFANCCDKDSDYHRSKKH